MDITPVAPRHPELYGTAILKNGLSAFHEALADYILMNPGATLRDKSAYFGYSIGWLCKVENTDMFRAYLAKRRKEVEVIIADSLPEKLAGAAHLVTERLIEVVAVSNDGDQILDAFDKVMHVYGYAPKGAQPGIGGVNQQGNIQNNFYVTAGELADARKTLTAAHAPAPALEHKKEDGGDPVSTS